MPCPAPLWQAPSSTANALSPRRRAHGAVSFSRNGGIVIAAMLKQILAVLIEIRDLLKPPTPPPTIPPGASPFAEKAPPYQKDPVYGFNVNALPMSNPTMGEGDDDFLTPDPNATRFPTMGETVAAEMMAVPPGPQTWTPAPGKAGPAWCYPNPALTPGKANPQVTQDTIASTLAIPGYTKTIRPPVSVTNVIKRHIMKRDGLTGDPNQWELDHWWPLCAGGAACDMLNFWCMPYAPYPGAREKDQVEAWLQHQIVSGAMTIDRAHAIINDDWFACYTSLHKMGLLPMMVSYDPDGSSDPDDNA